MKGGVLSEYFPYYHVSRRQFVACLLRFFLCSFHPA